jgi:uncharacterized repeat protein (TIGR01451 family)
MKRIHWWTLLGVGGTGIAATMLGQAVWGQPNTKGPAPLPPLVGQPLLPAAPSEMETPKDLAIPLPVLPPVPGTPTPSSDASLPALPRLPAPAVFKMEVDLPFSPVAKLETQRVEARLPDVHVGKQQPSISIEWVGPPTARVNQPMACQIVVRNTSMAPVQNVVIRHHLSEGVACKTSEPKAAGEGDELSWNLGTMAPNQTHHLSLLLVAKTRGPINCQATATFTAIAGHHVQVREPQLAVKVFAPEKIVIGDNVTLKFAVTNPGDGEAEAVRAKIVLAEGLEHPRGKVLEVDVGTLAPKETKTMQLTCAVKGGGTQKCTILTTADGSLTAHDSTSLEVLVPKIDVAIAGPKLRYLDRHAIYVLTVTNPGSAPATKVEVHEQIPIGFKFHQADHGGKYHEATRQVSWALGDVPPGQSREIAVDLIPIEAGKHRFIAYAKTSHGLKAEAESHTLVEGLPSLFMEVAHVDDPIEVGAETAYEIRVANTGTKTETNVEVICTLPEQIEFRSAKCSTTLRYRQEGRELVFEPLPRLAPKADVIYRVQVRGVAPGDIRFRTRIRADGLKEPVLREESTRVYSDDSPVRAASYNTPAPQAPATGNTMPIPASAPAMPVPVPSNPAPPSLPDLGPVAPAPLPAMPTVPAPVQLPTPLPIPPGN